LLYGCSFSDTHIVCTEGTETQYTCTCPGSSAVTVTVGTEFAGCGGDPPAVTDVIASVNENHVEAFLVRKIPEINSVDVQSHQDNSLTLVIDSDTTLSEQELKDSIADFIGNGVTADDVSVDVTGTTGKKRVASVVVVTVDDPNAPAPAPSSAVILNTLFGVLFSLLLTLFR